MADKEPRQPTHRAYSVIKREGQDDYWLNIGLVFPHKDNGGFNIMLQAFPLDGKIVCREITGRGRTDSDAPTVAAVEARQPHSRRPAPQIGSPNEPRANRRGSLSVPLLAPAILGPMHDRHDTHFSPVVVDRVHDDVWKLDQLARSRDETGPPHVRQIVCFEQTDPIPNAGDHLRCGARMILRDPCKYSIKVILRRLADGELHTPYRRRRRSLNSANEIVFGFRSASRCCTSAASSSLIRSGLLSCSSMTSTMRATSACRAAGQLITRSRISFT